MNYITDVDLKNFSTLRIGGRAKKVFFPKDEKEVLEVLKKAKDEDRKIIPLGKGSNIIFKDGILEDVFVSTKLLKKLEITKKGDEFLIYAEAGVSFKQIVELVKKLNLEGFENLSGIPASVGGAITMNAGAFGSEIFDIVEEVRFIDENLQVKTLKKEEISYSYRKTQFQQEGFVLAAKLRLKKSDKDIKALIKEHLLKRNKTQPLDLPTTGSTYKNPPNNYAGKLLELAGFKGKKIGDVGFSSKHANFLVNYGNGTFKDLKNLLENAEDCVYRQFGIKLEREVVIVE